jgi:uncharacterized protein YkwD
MPSPPRTALAVLACAGVLAAAAPSDAAPSPAEKRLVSRINDVRAAHGLRKLRISLRLSQNAHSWAVYLLRSDSFYHGRIASGTAENIAWATCSWARPRTIVRMWMNSSSHRSLLLARGFRYVGPGLAAGSWRGYGCVRMAVARFR